jgi:DNA helicase-2/ATP-dependent DNA helicase PcrA
MPRRKQDASPFVKDLNPSQRDAVTTSSGPLLVLAGAGSGKTRVVTFRIAELIRQGIKPQRILAVTFTNKAAAEMQDRVRQLLGRKLKQRPLISTFHAHCVQVLRRNIERLGYPARFAIYDRGDQESLARGVLREIKMDSTMLRPSDLLAIIGRWKTASVRPEQALSLAQTDREHLAAAAYRRYQRALKNAGAVDFDDLLLLTEQLFAKFADVRRDEAGLFDHLLVDEYQDTNASQYGIVKALAMGHRNLCVVGDDDQSIYAWRGAEVQHILRFKRDWPDAKVVNLEENYRSTAAILEWAGRLIQYNRVRHEKVIRPVRTGGERPQIVQYDSEETEARETVVDILRRLEDNVQPRDFAILFRTNDQPRPFETEMRRQQLPYVLLGGQSFFDRKEVRDILAYFKVLCFPTDDVPLLRVINNPPRGIGQNSVEKVMKAAIAAQTSAWKILKKPDKVSGLSPASRGAIGHFVETIEGYRRRLRGRGVSLAAAAKGLVNEIGYEQEIRRVYNSPEEQEMRWGTVEQAINAVAAYEKSTKRPTLRGFVEQTALDPREPDDDKQEQLRRNAVALLTLHAAKGLEFPHVYMVGMEEGLLPHHRSVDMDGEAIEEERRLCYVGITRAERCLTFSMALTRMKWGKPRETIPSRFLYEVTGQAEKAPSAARAKPAAARKRTQPPAKKKPGQPRRRS